MKDDKYIFCSVMVVYSSRCKNEKSTKGSILFSDNIKFNYSLKGTNRNYRYEGKEDKNGRIHLKEEDGEELILFQINPLFFIGYWKHKKNKEEGFIKVELNGTI